MVLENYFYGGAHIGKHSNNTLLYRVNMKPFLPPTTVSKKTAVCDVSSILPRVPVWTYVILTMAPSLCKWLREVRLCIQPRSHSMWWGMTLIQSYLVPMSGEREGEGCLHGRIPLSSANVVAHSFSHSANIYWAWLCARGMIHTDPLLSPNSWWRQVTPATDKESNRSQMSTARGEGRKQLPGWMPKT